MQFVDVVYAQNMFFVAVYGGWIASTRSGTSWRFVSPGPIDVRSLTFGDGIFAVVGSVGSLATSTDGLVWTVRDPGTKLWLSGVAYGHNSFVVVGNEGLIFQSDPIVPLGLTQGINTELSITGPPGRTCEIQAVDELLETNRWQVLRSVTLTDTPVSWTDDGSTNKPQRFYRAVLQPCINPNLISARSAVLFIARRSELCDPDRREKPWPDLAASSRTVIHPLRRGMSFEPSSPCVRSADFRPLHRLRCPAAQEFRRALGIHPRASGGNAAFLSLAQPPRCRERHKSAPPGQGTRPTGTCRPRALTQRHF